MEPAAILYAAFAMAFLTLGVFYRVGLGERGSDLELVGALKGRLGIGASDDLLRVCIARCNP